MELLNQSLSAEKQAVLDSILAKLPSSDYVDLDLPSKGRFYKKKGPFKVRPLGWKDEKALVTGKDDSVINTLLDSAVEGITSAEMLPMDRLFILFKLREITVGPSYEVTITCPQCGKLGDVTIDTSEFRVNFVPDDLKDPREVILPKSGIKVTVRFPRGVDEQYFVEASQALDNLWRIVVDIDGQSDPQIKAAVISNLLSPDLQAIRNAISTDYGLDSRFVYVCSDCKKESLVEAPVGPDFFLAN